jgi:hypothetical protein
MKKISFINIENWILQNTNAGENIAVIMGTMEVLDGRNEKRRVSIHRIVVSSNLKRSILGKSVELYTISKRFLNILFKINILSKTCYHWVSWCFCGSPRLTHESVGKTLFSYTINIALSNTALSFLLSLTLFISIFFVERYNGRDYHSYR